MFTKSLTLRFHSKLKIEQTQRHSAASAVREKLSDRLLWEKKQLTLKMASNYNTNVNTKRFN